MTNVNEYKINHSLVVGDSVQTREWGLGRVNRALTYAYYYGLSRNLECFIFKVAMSGARFSTIPERFRARKAISKTMKRLMYRAFSFNSFYN